MLLQLLQASLLEACKVIVQRSIDTTMWHTLVHAYLQIHIGIKQLA